MPSWADYCEKNLIASGAANRALVVSMDGSILAAAPQGVSLQRVEIQDIITGFEDPSAYMAKGIMAQGTKYMCLRAGEKGCYGKKGAEGIVIARSNQVFLCAITDLEKVDIATTGEVVDSLVEFLKKNGL